MPYCTVDDLLTGDIPLGTALNPDKYVQDAADEIDSKIGFIYKVPVDVNTAPAPVTLLLKRLNVHLATGRLITAATISAEDENLNAYGKSLIDDVELTLAKIAAGEAQLPDIPLAPTNTTGSRGPVRQGPQISNGDPESNVDAFYDRILNPQYIAPWSVGPNGSLVR